MDEQQIQTAEAIVKAMEVADPALAPAITRTLFTETERIKLVIHRLLVVLKEHIGTHSKDLITELWKELD